MRLGDISKAERRALAEVLGVKPQYLEMIVKGERHPSRKLAKRIELATGGKLTRMELLYPEEFSSGKSRSQKS